MSSQQEFNTVADETIAQLRFRIAQLNAENEELKEHANEVKELDCALWVKAEALGESNAHAEWQDLLEEHLGEDVWESGETLVPDFAIYFNKMKAENEDLKAENVIAKLFIKENAELKAHLKSLTDANGTSFSGWMEMKHELSLSKMAHNQLIDNMDLQLAQNEKLKAENEKLRSADISGACDSDSDSDSESEEDVCELPANHPKRRKAREELLKEMAQSGELKEVLDAHTIEYDSDNEEHSHKCQKCPNNAPDDQHMCGKCR
tara:strand:- start:586 stop:1374 length:789 start_codon:yes stop_codon:yes gene_type:complete